MKLITTPLRASTNVMHGCVLLSTTASMTRNLPGTSEVPFVFTTARLCGEASRGTCHMRWAPISKWYVSRVLQHPLRRRFRSSQGSWCPYFTRNPQLLPPDLHQRLLAGNHMKLLVHQAPHLHHQRRLPRPRHSTRFLKSLPSLYKQKSHSHV